MDRDRVNSGSFEAPFENAEIIGKIIWNSLFVLLDFRAKVLPYGFTQMFEKFDIFRFSF